MIRLLISTRDRADTLKRCLDRLAQVVVPDGGLEILVVDNGSIDHTPAVLDQFMGRLPLHALHEQMPGKNRALNNALETLGRKAEESELIVFSDDDVLPCPEWLTSLQGAARGHPETDLFGGPISIVWSSPPPPWLSEFDEYFDVLFAERGGSDEACRADALWGPNLAIRGRCFADGLRYDAAFGPDGTRSYPMGSETELMLRLASQGSEARFVAAAMVGHMIDGSQLTRAHVARRAMRHGAGVAKRDFAHLPGRRVVGVPLFLWRYLAQCIVGMGVDLFSGRRTRAGYDIHWLVGAMRQCRADASHLLLGRYP